MVEVWCFDERADVVKTAVSFCLDLCVSSVRCAFMSHFASHCADEETASWFWVQ